MAQQKKEVENRFYILPGTKENWEIAIKEQLWGFSERSHGLWRTAIENDLLVFYVTHPVKKIIGFGVITSKSIGDRLIWNDEKLFGRSLWRYRISFDIFHIIEDWEQGISVPKSFILRSPRRVIDKSLFTELVKKAELEWNVKINIKINGK